MRFEAHSQRGTTSTGRLSEPVRSVTKKGHKLSMNTAFLVGASAALLTLSVQAHAQDVYFPFTDGQAVSAAPVIDAGHSASTSMSAKPLDMKASVQSDRSITNEFRFLSRRLFGLDNMVGISVFDAIGSADAVRKNQRIRALCARVDERYRSLGWNRSPCNSLPWTYDRVSEQGYPLIYWDYSGLTWGRGEPPPDESTMVFGGVHPDELTPINLAFRFAEALNRDAGLFAQHRVVVAPLVNPDGFFMFPARRTNSNGVDLNRNFATRDWWTSATSWWRQRRNSDPRHFPGVAPETEEGTRFQVDLMNRYQPDKVVSIHAPLGFLDYDGPGDNKRQNLSDFEKKARDLAYIVSRNSNNYRVLDFAFYPGSLGNYAGNERHVPTVTLELSSTNPRFAEKYWREFFPGLRAAVKYEFKRSALARLETLSRQTQPGMSANSCCLESP
jgi:protein MpaA